MISLPLPIETEKIINQLSEQEKKILSALIQDFVGRSKRTKFPDLALPGAVLSTTDMENLAAEMEADHDFVNEQNAEAYLGQLKAEWSKEKQ